MSAADIERTLLDILREAHLDDAGGIAQLSATPDDLAGLQASIEQAMAALYVSSAEVRV